jgi:hypothetical protein
MTIRDLVAQGLHYARTCRSLWLFGFFMAASGGSNGGAGGGAGNSGAGASALPPPFWVALIAVVVILAAMAFVMRFVSEGALIEGIVLARQGRHMTTGDGFRAGWAHWGVLFRIGVLYVLAMIAAVAVFMIPCVIAFRAFGAAGGLAVGIPALVVTLPIIITVVLLQAFAARIAVLEHRTALDAIYKARLFLHGRIRHGLKLIVATFAGTFVIGAIGAAAVAPIALLLVALTRVLQIGPVFALGAVALVPIGAVVAAMIGTLRSSIWTIGYLTQVDS